MNPEDITQPTNLPPLTGGEHVETFLSGDKWLSENLTGLWLDFTRPYTPPRWTLTMNDTNLAPIGGVGCVGGLSGHGKSTFLSIICATILGGSFGRMRFAQAGEIERPVVLLVDTEQEIDNVIAFKNRVCSLIGRGIQEEMADFKVLMLRETETAERRWRRTLRAIFEVRPTVCLIDGMLDIVADFNNNIECQEIIYKILQTVSHYDCHIWCVLHVNPTGTFDKLVGHLGSALERKVSDIVMIDKRVNDKTGEVSYEVAPKKSRGHKDFDKWEFRIKPYSEWGVPEMIQEPLTGDIDHIEDMIRWLSESKSDIPQPASKTDIKEVLKRNGIRNNDRLARDVEALINRHILKPQAREEWAQGQKAPKYYLQLDDSEPKSKPIACDNLDEVVEWLSEDLLDIPQPASKTDIKNVLKRHGVTNNDRLSADCEALIKRGVLTERPEFERVAGETEPKYYLRVK